MGAWAAWGAWGAWGRTFLFISLKVKKISASNFTGALPTTAATHVCKNNGINKPERILSALSVHQRWFFINIFKDKKDARLEIGKAVIHSISHIYIELQRNQSTGTLFICIICAPKMVFY